MGFAGSKVGGGAEISPRNPLEDFIDSTPIHVNNKKMTSSISYTEDKKSRLSVEHVLS